MARSTKPRKSASLAGPRAQTAGRTGQTPRAARAIQSRPGRRRRLRLSAGWVALGVIVLIAVAAVGFVVFGSSLGQQAGNQGQYPYSVGTPGPSAQAPAIQLTATDSSRFDLTAWRGKTVLLYFQEGVGCQPCWDQLKDIQSNFSQLQALGIQQVVTITGDPLDALQQKASLEGITTPVLADPGLTVSRAYSANQYGMMGSSADGHTFIVVGPDGVIQWRADYGGPPKYTMYLPVANLVADLQQGLKKRS